MSKRKARPQASADSPEAIAEELKKLGIRMRDVLAAYNALMVPEGWTDSFGPLLPLAKRLNRSKTDYGRRLRRLADDLDKDVIPFLAECRRLFNLKDIPGLKSIPTAMRAMAGYLIPGPTRTEQQNKVLKYLSEISQCYPKRGRKHSTQFRDIRIDLLCLLFENRTKKPRHALVADIMNWQSGNELQLTADDVKKARGRAAPFSIIGERYRSLFCS